MTCPNCDSDDCDFIVNNEAKCGDCGYRWTQDLEDQE